MLTSHGYQIMFETYFAYSLRNPIPCFSTFITLLPIVLIIIRKAYLDPTFKLLLFYLLFKLITDLLIFHSVVRQQNSIVFFNISIPIFYSLLAGTFYYKFSSRANKKGILYSIAGFLVFSIWDISNSNLDVTDFQNHRAVLFAKTVEGVLIIVLILLYFYEIINSLVVPDLLTFPFFWVCSGLLLYYSSFIFIAPILHYTATWKNIQDLGIARTVPYIFEIICALFFSVGVYHFSADDYAKQ